MPFRLRKKADDNVSDSATESTIRSDNSTDAVTASDSSNTEESEYSDTDLKPRALSNTAASIYRTAEFLDVSHQVENPVMLTFENLTFSITNHYFSPMGFLKRLKSKGFINPETKKCDFFTKAGFKRFFYEKSKILHTMDGQFVPGRLTCIMGPSGAGKTSFLNIISGRLASGFGTGRRITMTRKVNGHSMGDDMFKEVTGYVTQEDALFPLLSPREHLIYSAYLRLPHTMSWKQKFKRIRETLEILGLAHCARTRVGSPETKAGLSGGERRRTSIALELLVNPRVLFLDEPTSGLDSTTAEQVVSILKDVARQGRTVVCTIHQPSKQVFSQFDDVYWLAKGKMMYSGPRENLRPWFTDLGYPCPLDSNPSDYYMRLLARSPDLSVEEHKAQLDKFYEAHKENTQLYQPKETYTKKVTKETASARFYWQFLVLFHRTTKNIIRNPASSIAKVITTTVMAIFVAAIFFQLSHDQDGVQDFQGALFLCITFSIFPPANEALQFFPLEKAVFFREYRSGMYKVVSYYLALVLARIPLQIFLSVLFGVIVYFPVGFDYDVEKFFIFLIVLAVIYGLASAFGLLMSIPLELETAMGLLPIIVIPLLIVSGIFINLDDIGYYIIWMQYISFLFYGYCALIINEFEGMDFYCESDQYVDGECQFTKGEQVIDFLGMDGFDIWSNILALFATYVFFVLSGYFCLLCVAKRRSKL